MKDNERITEEEFSVMLLKFPELIYALYYRAEDEIDRLNNIIDELEKWLKESQAIYGINQQGFSWGVCGDALNKLKELKEGK